MRLSVVVSAIFLISCGKTRPAGNCVASAGASVGISKLTTPGGYVTLYKKEQLSDLINLHRRGESQNKAKLDAVHCSAVMVPKREAGLRVVTVWADQYCIRTWNLMALEANVYLPSRRGYSEPIPLASRFLVDKARSLDLLVKSWPVATEDLDRDILFNRLWNWKNPDLRNSTYDNALGKLDAKNRVNALATNFRADCASPTATKICQNNLKTYVADWTVKTDATAAELQAFDDFEKDYLAVKALNAVPPDLANALGAIESILKEFLNTTMQQAAINGHKELQKDSAQRILSLGYKQYVKAQFPNQMSAVSIDAAERAAEDKIQLQLVEFGKASAIIGRIVESAPLAHSFDVAKNTFFGFGKKGYFAASPLKNIKVVKNFHINAMPAWIEYDSNIKQDGPDKLQHAMFLVVDGFWPFFYMVNPNNDESGGFSSDLLPSNINAKRRQDFVPKDATKSKATSDSISADGPVPKAVSPVEPLNPNKYSNENSIPASSQGDGPSNGVSDAGAQVLGDNLCL